MNDLGDRRLPQAPRGPSAVASPRRAFGYTGRMATLLRIVVVNFLLSVVTVSIYRFWGKTRLRRYLWGQVTFEGEPLEYTGRGLELFIGFLIVIAILLPIGLLQFAVDYVMTGYPDQYLALVTGANIVQVLIIVFLIQIAIFRARRYRLTRTQWRGTRGGQTGSSVRYAVIVLGWSIVTALTVGLAYPVMQTRTQKYLMENTWFGNNKFDFTAKARALFPRWVLALVLFIPTLSLSWLWYRVRTFRYFVGQTTYGNLSFASDLSSSRVVWVIVRYVLASAVVGAILTAFLYLAMVQFGLGPADFSPGPKPVGAAAAKFLSLGPLFLVVMMVVGFGLLRIPVFVHLLLGEICKTLVISGQEDFDAIRQSAQEQPRFGEGLADALDVGSF